MINDKDLTSAGVLHLLGLYSKILDELRRRGIVKSVNNPAADYAEHLCCSSLKLTSAPNSTKGFDATDRNGKRYEIKSRRLTKRSKPTRFSAIRKLEENHFDFLIAVLFAEDFTVSKASIIPRETIVKRAFWQKHVNAWILPLNDDLWHLDGAKDISQKLRQTQTAESR